jgi:hypothetical protein
MKVNFKILTPYILGQLLLIKILKISIFLFKQAKLIFISIEA